MALTSMLVQCTSRENSVSEELNLEGAQQATEWTQRLTRSILDIQLVRPGALLGIYVSDYLVHTSFYKSAIAGIEAQMQLLFDEDFENDESFELLTELGTMLQVDIRDMLNRSMSRSRAFDTYVQSLTELGEVADNHAEALRQDLDAIADERRAARKEASSLQSELNRALRSQDFSSASGLQQRLLEAKTILADVEAREDEKRGVIRLFEDLLDVAEERLHAMNTNREALIAGIKVIEVPGVKDLGILEQGSRRRSGGSGFDSTIIDPFVL